MGMRAAWENRIPQHIIACCMTRCQARREAIAGEGRLEGAWQRRLAHARERRHRRVQARALARQAPACWHGPCRAGRGE
eukprot:1083592-Pyramimonas_sp.AAC.1